MIKALDFDIKCNCYFARVGACLALIHGRTPTVERKKEKRKEKLRKK